VQQQQVNIRDLTVEQLKAFAYDQAVAINQRQQTLAALEAELDRRRAEQEAIITPTLAESSKVPLHEIAPREHSQSQSE
jgi:hypothetical protein